MTGGRYEDKKNTSSTEIEPNGFCLNNRLSHKSKNTIFVHADKKKPIIGNRVSKANIFKGLDIRVKVENVRLQIEVVSALSVCLPGVSSQGKLANDS